MQKFNFIQSIKISVNFFFSSLKNTLSVEDLASFSAHVITAGVHPLPEGDEDDRGGNCANKPTLALVHSHEHD